MKYFIEVLSFFAWTFLTVLMVAWGYLHWEDRQDVMTYMDRKPNTAVVIDGELLRVAIIGEKRLDCQRVPWSEYGHVIIDGYDTEASFRWANDLSPLSTFSKGKLDIGIAEFGVENIKEAEFVGFSIAHKCHGIEKRSPVYWFGVTK